MNPTRTTKATAAALATAALVTSAVVAAADGAEAPGARTITAREKVASVHIDHQKRSTKGQALATGDRVVTRQKIFDQAGKRTGTLNTDCVNVGKKVPVFFKAVLQCNTSYVFADGQIAVAGTLQFGKNASAPIVGGTGAYRGARGLAQAGPPVKGYDSVDLIELDK